MRARTSIFLLVLVGCEGPEAPDPALCRDCIHRLCAVPVCPQIEPLFAADAGCETVLQTRSGCFADDFAFTKPNRARFLAFRAGLLREGGAPEAHPSCDDVGDAFARYPDVAAMFREIR